MKKHSIRNKKVRYAGISVMLTVAILVVTVLLNAVLSSLVTRYSLYTSLIGEQSFAVSEECYDLLEDAFEKAEQNGRRDEVKIIFCDKESVVSQYSHYNYFIYNTVKELSARFDNIKVEYTDIYTHPTEELKKYTVSYHPLTGEELKTPLLPSSVVVTSGDYHAVYSYTDFYSYESEDVSEAWGYAGERKMTAALLRAVESERHIAVLMLNHGEVLADYEIMAILSDAGYTVVTLDIYNEEIPKECDLLISFNPKTDLVADDLSEKSEIEIIDNFLSVSGHAFYVFLDKSTRELPNFERYLKEWGVSANYWEGNGVSYRYSIQDEGGSLTSDGCTIYGSVCDSAKDAYVSEEKFVVFQNATALERASENYTQNSDGSYTWASRNRTMYPIYESSENSLSWANGQVVDGGSQMMLSITEQKNEDGTSYVGVISSANFAKREFLQSAVYGNADVLLHLFEQTGGQGGPKGLKLIPFNYRVISTVTTSQILMWTLTLTIVPAVLITAVALTVLIRRRRA